VPFGNAPKPPRDPRWYFQSRARTSACSFTQLLDRIVPAMEDVPAELARRGADILRRGGIPMGSQVREHWTLTMILH